MKTKIILFITTGLLGFYPLLSQNTNLGTNAGNAGSNNTSIGANAGNVVTGGANIFVGKDAGLNNTTGFSNTIVGESAGELLTTNSYNSFFGRLSGSETNGERNCYFGYGAGYHGTVGDYNVYMGFLSGSFNEGSNNVFIGSRAGNQASGSGNVCIGNSAGEFAGSNELYIANDSGNPPLIYGDFTSGAIGLGTKTPGSYRLYVNGDAFATGMWVSSDKRFKQNEKVIEGALERVKSISGFTYQFKQDESIGERNFSKGNQMGFLAQDLQKVFPDLVKDDGSGYLAVNYQSMIPVLVEAIKELSGQLQQQSIELELLRQSLTDQTELRRSPLVGRLYQNVPNPSKSETRIAYELSETTQSGLLYIFDLQGKSIASYPVSQRQGEVTIPSGKLAAGLYHYSLVVGGKIVDTKKMLVAE